MFGVERMIEQMGFKATILRPAYFMNNELVIKDAVTRYGVYPMPIGSKGLAMIDARDIGEIAAIELIRRENCATPLPRARDRLWRRRHRWIREEPQAVHADLDGLRHASHERAISHRRHDS